MTERDLHRLNRRELLQLLLAQSEELEATKAERDQVTAERDQLAETYERLRKRLDQKDAHIHGLRELLESQRNKRRIELAEAGNIAEAALQLTGIFEAAQKAADQYLYNVQLLAESGGQIPEEDLNPEELEEAKADKAAGEDVPMDAWNRDMPPVDGGAEEIKHESE